MCHGLRYICKVSLCCFCFSLRLFVTCHFTCLECGMFHFRYIACLEEKKSTAPKKSSRARERDNDGVEIVDIYRANLIACLKSEIRYQSKKRRKWKQAKKMKFRLFYNFWWCERRRSLPIRLYGWRTNLFNCAENRISVVWQSSLSEWVNQ